MSGWVKLSRQILSSDLWTGEKFTRGQAWVDLLMLTNHSDGFIRVAGQKIDIKRGQCGWSQLRLSGRWSWSRGKTKRFFIELENEQMITCKTNNRNSIITICNYSKFQSSNIEDSTTDDTADSTTDEHQTNIKQDTKKNDKKEDNEKNGNKKLPFLDFYSKYPVKKSKAAAEKSWRSMSLENQELAISGVSDYLKANDPKYYAHPSTYLNNKRWEDEANQHANIGLNVQNGISRQAASQIAALERIKAM